MKRVIYLLISVITIVSLVTTAMAQNLKVSKKTYGSETQVSEKYVVKDRNPDIPHEISYQGYLEENGEAANGDYDITFWIYESESGGSYCWGPETHDNVPVTEGRFSVVLGSISPIPLSCFTGTERWLQITIEGTTLTPRTKLTSIGYTYVSEMANNATMWTNHDWGDLYPNANATQIQGRSVSSGDPPNDWEVLKWTGSEWTPMPDEIGEGYWTQSGSNLYPNSTNWRVGIGTNNPSEKLEVAGKILTSDGFNIESGDDIYAADDITVGDDLTVGDDITVNDDIILNGSGSRINATSADLNYPILEIDNSSTGNYAVHGIDVQVDKNQAICGNSSDGTGVMGEGYGPNGIGIYGTSVSGMGVRGWSISGNGVYGESSNSGNGVYGESSNGYGVYGRSTSSYGVSGLSFSSSNAGVYGFNSSGGDGVYGLSSYGEGVVGISGSSYGVDGESTDGPGIFGYSANSWAGWFQGSVYATGGFHSPCPKSTVISLDNNKTQLYSIESPEVWFEDFNVGELLNGQTLVNIDPTFLQTVNTHIDYHVFLTPYGDCNGLYISNQTSSSFEVRELNRGTSNIRFSYRIVAKRRGYEDTRLEKVEIKELHLTNKHERSGR